MEKLKNHFIQLTKALKTVEVALDYQQEVTTLDCSKSYSGEMLLIVEDAVIQRFGYTYESFRIFLKKYLKAQSKKISRQKKLFYVSAQMGICTTEDSDIFIHMFESRNNILHEYSFEVRQKALDFMPKYYAAMMNVVNRLSGEFN